MTLSLRLASRTGKSEGTGLSKRGIKALLLTLFFPGAAVTASVRSMSIKERIGDLIQNSVARDDPKAELIHVLESAMELVEIPGNDFTWSSWESADEARNEIQSLIAQIRSGRLPDRLDVSVLFAPTGPLQELSLSSGWAESFLKIAGRFDEVERAIWRKGPAD